MIVDNFTKIARIVGKLGPEKDLDKYAKTWYTELSRKFEQMRLPSEAEWVATVKRGWKEANVKS